EIWEKAKNDTIGLEKFYADNISKYQWKDRVEADIYSSTSHDVIKKAAKFLKQGKDAAFIKSKLNTADKVNVIEKSGTFEKDSEVLPKLNKWKAGVSDVVKDGNYYFVVKIAKTLPAGPKTLEENRGRVINDYQQQLEANWVSELKKEFKVSVNNEVFQKVKKQLNQ
ncbi:MAG: peptidyl-prolyl cis-trans isomerase, partial [Flavobacterium sp.]